VRLRPGDGKLTEPSKEHIITDQPFSYSNHAQIHGDTVHKFENAFICTGCGKEVEERDDRDRHWKNCKSRTLNTLPEITKEGFVLKETQRNPRPPGSGKHERQGRGNGVSTSSLEYGSLGASQAYKGVQGKPIDRKQVQNALSRKVTKGVKLNQDLMACRDWRHNGSGPGPKSCSHPYESQARLFEHERRKHQQFWCIKCLSRFENKDQLREHEANRRICTNCYSICLKSKEELEGHRWNCVQQNPRTWEERWQIRYKKDYDDNVEHNPRKICVEYTTSIINIL
jgi:hypothetical protein